MLRIGGELGLSSALPPVAQLMYLTI